ncbi:hypothetical protein RF11_10147 [Thelohanellus kitauei]|uniref:Tc1-like transposase DDE domain-containing protein n=1 Tax=Thelohanellus kitauei TaxID=669202 RepID=A0A0C2MFU3_THEKT|nr:hypothetical protein RF11_10147 [Thelohanellus kitauei]
MSSNDNSKKSMSLDIKKIIMNLVIEEGKPESGVSRTLRITGTTVRSFLKKYETSDRIEADQRGGSRYAKITFEQLFLENNQADSRKRNNPEIKAERREYVLWYQSILPHLRYSHIVYVDESKGTTPNLILTNSRGQNVTMLLAIICYNIIQCDAVVGYGVDAETFSSFPRRLVAVFGEGDFTIVMDNVRFHHTAGDTVNFLNPCEEAFGMLKNRVRRDGVPQGTDDLVCRMTNSCAGIPVNSLSNFVAHAETFSNKCLNLEDIPRNRELSNKLSISIFFFT